MAKTFDITLSDAEYKALGFVALDPEEWIRNLVKFRCDEAINQIVQSEVERLFAEGKPITGSKEDIVLAAEIESAAKRQARHEAELEALRAQQE